MSPAKLKLKLFPNLKFCHENELNVNYKHASCGVPVYVSPTNFSSALGVFSFHTINRMGASYSETLFIQNLSTIYIPDIKIQAPFGSFFTPIFQTFSSLASFFIVTFSRFLLVSFFVFIFCCLHSRVTYVDGSK